MKARNPNPFPTILSKTPHCVRVCCCYGPNHEKVVSFMLFPAGIEFRFSEMPIGGAALDSTGVPLPEETLAAAKESDAVLLGAIGGLVE